MSDSSKIADFPESVKRNWDAWCLASSGNEERKRYEGRIEDAVIGCGSAFFVTLIIASFVFCHEHHRAYDSFTLSHLWDTLAARITVWFFPLLALLLSASAARRVRPYRGTVDRDRVQLADPRAHRINWLFRTRFAIEAAMFRNTTRRRGKSSARRPSRTRPDGKTRLFSFPVRQCLA